MNKYFSKFYRDKPINIMMNNFFFRLKSLKLLKLIILTVIIFFILLPLNKFGLSDNEELKAGIFSLLILFRDFYLLNISANYIDQIGPGLSLPLGQGLFFFPTNLLIFNYKIFFNITILVNLLIQFGYIQKINKLIFKKSYFYLSLFILASFSNFSYLYYTDWISCLVTYSLYFPVIYYSIKYLDKKKIQDYLKILLFIALIIINGHIGFGVSLILFLIPFIIFNNQYFFLRNKYFYLGILLFIIIIFDRIYPLINIHLNTKTTATALHEGYVFQDFYYLIERIFYIFNKFISTIFEIDVFKEIYPPNARIPSYGLIIFVSLVYSLWIIIKKNSNKIYHLNKIFLFFFILCFFPHNWFPNFFSGTWILRDILNILSFILFIKLFISVKIKIKIILNLFLLTSVLAYPEAYVYLKNNFIYDLKQVDTKVINEPYYIEKLASNNNLNKIYIAPELFDDIEQLNIPEFINQNILDTKSFLKYDIYPFNTWIKNQKLNSLRNPEFKMYASTYPNFEEINNEVFFKIFRINKLLIYEKNLNKININIYEIVDKINTVNGNILILSLKNPNNIIIKHENIYKIKNHNCGLYEVMICLINNNFFSESSDIVFKRLKNLNYELINKSNKEINYLIPLISNNYWNKKNKIWSINPDLHVINLKPNETVLLKYLNIKILIIRLISIIAITFTFIIVFLFKFKKLKIS
jgi:hypothetical protein